MQVLLLSLPWAPFNRPSIQLGALKGFLDLPHGTPAHDTFGDVFRVLDPAVFESS